MQKQYIPVSIPAPETQWQVFFDDVDLGPDDIVGEVDKGFGILFKSLNPERIWWDRSAAALAATL